jgi:hypothetical protein
MDLMAKKSGTSELRSGISGQHVSLAVAAHLARTQLVPEPLKVYDGQHLSDMLDVVAQALARTASLHVIDAHTGETRELVPVELEGAVARRGATLLVLKDGRALSGVSVRRADLRQAIALLKAIGLPELAVSPPPAVAGTPVLNGNGEALRARLAEVEDLLKPPLLPAQVERAKAGAVWIARHAPQGRVANLAMQLISALHESRGIDEIPGGFRMALARLRTLLEETASSS